MLLRHYDALRTKIDKLLTPKFYTSHFSIYQKVQMFEKGNLSNRKKQGVQALQAFAFLYSNR